MRVVAAPDFPALRERLARDIAAVRARDPLVPVSVLVPSDVSRAETRRDLARRLGGTIAVGVVSLPRWIDETARLAVARSGGRRLSEAGFERLAARVLSERARRGRTGPLLAAADAPGTSRLLASTLADLYEGGFDPHGDEIAAAVRGDPARRELPDLFRAFDDALHRESFFDRRRVERTAVELLREQVDANATPSPAPLFAFGFHDLTPVQRALLLEVSRRRDVSLFVPGPAPEETSAGEAAVAPLLSWATAAGAPIELAPREGESLLTLTHDLFRGPALRDPGPSSLELCTYATESAEVRGIAGRILEEVRENGRSFEDFLVTVPARSGPPPLSFRHVFGKAGIPLHEGIGVPGTRTAGGRRALALARAQGASRDAREIDALDFLAPPDRAAPDAPATTEAFVRARDAAEIAARFRELHASRFGEPPAREVEEALDAIALVFGSRPLRPRDFAAMLAATLDATRVRAPSESGGVLLLTMDAARGIARPVVFHAGLVRGAVRRPPGEDPLLPDVVRSSLVDLHAHRGLRLSVTEDRVNERLLLARFAFESATERAILSFAQRDRVGGEPRNPSGLLLDVASAQRGRPLDPHGAEFLQAAPPRSRERARQRPVDATDLDVAVLGGDLPPEGDDLVRLLGEARARHLPRVLRAAQSRWGEERLGPWDGVLSNPGVIRRVAELIAVRRWSPTSLEALANCPFSFLLKLLGLDEPGEEGDDFDPMERGRLFHTLAEETYLALLARGRLPLEPSALPEALALLDEGIRREGAGLGGEPALRRLHRRATLAELRNDLSLVLAREAHRTGEDRTVPVHFELAFGGEPDEPSPTFPLAGGRMLPLRGKVDRVDRRGDGALEVVDFKTGQTRAKSGALRYGIPGKQEIRLQLPLYLEAVPQVVGAPVARATYYHATSDRRFEEIQYGRGDLERDREEIGRVLAHVVARARAGWFPCTPGAQRCCHARNTPACGPAVVERFRRKRTDPELATHLALVRGDGEPEEVS